MRVRVQVERELGRAADRAGGAARRRSSGSRSRSARARRGVRMREQAERLELGELGADGRRRRTSGPRRLDERLRARPAGPSRRTPRRRAGGSPADAG